MKRAILIILSFYFLNEGFTQIDNNCFWFKRLNYNINSQPYSVYNVIDENEFIYLSGYFDKDSKIESDTNIYHEGFFIAKYDSNANLLWIKRLSLSPSWCYVNTLKYKNGFLYTTGMYSDTLVIGNDTLPITPYYDPFYIITKWDTLGNLIWYKVIPQHDEFPPGPTVEQPFTLFSIDIDSNDNLLVFGNFSLDITFDTITLINNYHPYVRFPFFAKLNSNGETQWLNYIKIESDFITLNYESFIRAACFNANDEIVAIVSLGDSNVIFDNSSVNYNLGANYIKINSDGNLLSIRNIPNLHLMGIGKMIYSNQNNIYFCCKRADFQDSQFYIPSFCTIKFNNHGIIEILDTNYYIPGIDRFNYFSLIYDNDNNDLFIGLNNSSAQCIIQNDTINNSNGFLFLKLNDNLILTGYQKIENKVFSLSKRESSYYTTGYFRNQYNCNGNIIFGDNNYWNNFVLKQKANYSAIDYKKEVISKEIIIYPNPTSETLNINLNIFQQESVLAEIYNLQGERVVAHLLTPTQTSIPISKLVTGLYFCRITNSDKSVTVKFVKE